MKNPNERLKEARELHFATAREAADALGVNRQTYAGHENGADGFPVASAIKYARRFKMSLDWLFTGKGKGPEKRSSLTRQEWKDDLEWSLQSALQEGAAAGEISAFITETLLDNADKRQPVNTKMALRSALVAYGVDHRSLERLMAIIDGYAPNREAEDLSEQTRPDDQSERATHPRARVPSE